MRCFERFCAIALLLLSMLSQAQNAPDPDLNNDGIVDTLELSLVASCFGLAPSQVPRCACTDSDGNDLIDQIDYNFVLEAYGQTGFPLGPSPCLVNRAPIADAGDDQLVDVGARVSLDGSGSSDPDGESLNFRWQLRLAPPGSTAQLSDPNEAMPQFTADQPGTYEFELVVLDSATASAPDLVRVATNNRAPLANAGADDAALVGGALSARWQ